MNNAAVIAVIQLGIFAGMYFVYARFLANKVYSLDPSLRTPAHEFEDGVDFVPTRPIVLLGHHFASIAGAAPIVGPAIAVIWGWVPALLWVVLAPVLIGGVHDFGALLVSMRHQGRSIGDLTEDLVGPWCRNLFLIVIFFLLLLVIAVFAIVIAVLFAWHPHAILPVFSLMVIAPITGFLIYRTRIGLGPATFIGLALMFIMIYVGSVQAEPIGKEVGRGTWIVVLCIYAFLASCLPVWWLLQPRDYLNSFKLYIGLGSIYLGLFIVRPQFVAPSFRSVPDSPSIIPFLFIVIACGAVSGFHSLVSSGTTAKQIDNEKDARLIGYGGMLCEGSLATLSVIACTAGLGVGAATLAKGQEVWLGHYQSWGKAAGLGKKVSAFVVGSANLLNSGLGLDQILGETWIAVVVVAFGMTTLDSATRLLRYIVNEIGANAHVGALENKYVGAFIAAGGAYLLASLRFGAKPTGLVLWPLFGATNQILAALALLTVSVYLLKRGKPTIYTMAPMVFMLLTAGSAMSINFFKFVKEATAKPSLQSWTLVVMGGLILVSVVGVVIESFRAMTAHKREVPVGGR